MADFEARAAMMVAYQANFKKSGELTERFFDVMSCRMGTLRDFHGRLRAQLGQQINAWPNASHGFHGNEVELFGANRTDVGDETDALITHLADLHAQVENILSPRSACSMALHAWRSRSTVIKRIAASHG